MCAVRISERDKFFTSVCVNASDTKATTRVVLPAGAWVVAGTINTPQLTHDVVFTSAMAESGKLRLIDAAGEVKDFVGWGSANEFWGAGPALAPNSTMSLQRHINSQGKYLNTPDNAKDFIRAPFTTIYQVGLLYEVTDTCVNLIGLQVDVPVTMIQNARGECVERASINFCEGITINEIGANTTRQYIELYNPTKTTRTLEGCRLLTNRSSTNFHLLHQTLPAAGHLVIYIDETPLKLTKTTSGTVYLVASDQETETDSRYYEDLSSDTSWSAFSDGWKQTYALTPGEQNAYTQYPSCEEGQIRNLATGRCRKVTSLSSNLKPCREGQYRSEETNRCRTFALATSVRKPCADDQFRNPLTNRCKKIASVDELKDCGEGRERNPTTNRCRNIIRSDVPAAAFAVEPIKEVGMAFSGWWALGGVLMLALAYAGWEWRYEVRSGVHSLLARIGRIK